MAGSEGCRVTGRRGPRVEMRIDSDPIGPCRPVKGPELFA